MVKAEKSVNKSLYKITLFSLKLIPMSLAACALVNTVFSFYGIRFDVLSMIGGVSFLNLAFLYLVDASDAIMRRAYQMMESKDLNTGFTFTNQDSKLAVVVIGPTSSEKEFINTLCHEVHHLAVAIAEGLGLSLDSEGPAYLNGDSMMELTKIICALGCKRCNKKRKRPHE